MPVQRMALRIVASLAMVVATAIAVNQVLDDGEWNWWALGIALVIATGATLLTLKLDLQEKGGTPGTATHETRKNAAEVLALWVAAQWENEAGVRMLDDPHPIPVHWRTAEPRLMAQSQNVAGDSTPDWSGTSRDISELAAWFRGLRRRRLVVLGDRGSGKTTLAVQLVRELLAAREDGDPVPVLLSVSSWAPERQPDVWRWLADQLRLGYPALSAPEFGGRAYLDLALDRMVLPVLDGLDEIPEPSRVAVFRALNSSLGSGGLILTCRTDEYVQTVSDAAGVLTGAAVIQSMPISPHIAAEYLLNVLPPMPSQSWWEFLDALSTGSSVPLAEICASPLGLWLIRTTQNRPDSDPASLADTALYPTTAALRAHLFDRLIPAVIEARPPTGDPADLFRPRKRRDPNDVARWLGYLAHLLTFPRADGGRPRTRDFAWWHLARSSLSITRLRATVGLTVGMTTGLAFAAVFNPEVGLVLGLAAGPIFGFTAGRTSRSLLDDEPGHADLGLRKRGFSLCSEVRTGCMASIVFGSAIALLTGLIAGFQASPAVGVATGVVFAFLLGPPFGLVFSVTNWAETPADTDRSASPMMSLRPNRALTLFRIALSWLVFGLLFGVGGALLTGSPKGLIWSVLGLSFGLMVELAGRHRAWTGYLIASFWLAKSGHLPLRLMPFLEDAHRIGLLRAVGPIYQFRHAELQDHLAARYEASQRTHPTSIR